MQMDSGSVLEITPMGGNQPLEAAIISNGPVNLQGNLVLNVTNLPVGSLVISVATSSGNISVDNLAVTASTAAPGSCVTNIQPLQSQHSFSVVLTVSPCQQAASGLAPWKIGVISAAAVLVVGVGASVGLMLYKRRRQKWLEAHQKTVVMNRV